MLAKNMNALVSGPVTFQDVLPIFDKDMLEDEEADQSKLTQYIHRYIGG